VVAVAAAAQRPAPTVRRDNNPRSPRSGAQVQVRPTAVMPAVIVKRSLSRLVTTAASPQLRLLPTPTRTLRNGKNTRTAFISAVVPTRCACCPSLPNCPAGLLTVKTKPLRGGLRPALTAPTPSGDRQLSEEQGEKWPGTNSLGRGIALLLFRIYTAALSCSHRRMNRGTACGSYRRPGRIRGH
jgi:hypothetical protein